MLTPTPTPSCLLAIVNVAAARVLTGGYFLPLERRGQKKTGSFFADQWSRKKTCQLNLYPPLYVAAAIERYVRT